MSWYAAAVTGNVPSYVADKEKWDLAGYIETSGGEYTPCDRMNRARWDQARALARTRMTDLARQQAKAEDRDDKNVLFGGNAVITPVGLNHPVKYCKEQMVYIHQ
jgi:hypothetical protein